MANIPLGGKDVPFLQKHSSPKHRSPLARDILVASVANEFSFKPPTSNIFGSGMSSSQDQPAHTSTDPKDLFSINKPGDGFSSNDSKNISPLPPFKDCASRALRHSKTTATQAFLSGMNIKPGTLRSRSKSGRFHSDQKSTQSVAREENSTKASNIQDEKNEKWMASPEEVAHLTSILLKGLPPEFNNHSTLYRYFSKFGHIIRVNCNPGKDYATIRFFEHKEAKAAKEEGKDVIQNCPTISIFWSKSVIPRNKETSIKTHPRKVEVQKKKKENEPSLPGKKRPLSHNLPLKKKPSAIKGEKTALASSETVGIETSCTDTKALQELVSSQASSVFDKLQILNARDNLLRLRNAKHSTSYTDSIIVGTCPDMCPEKERYSRVEKNFLSIFEKKNGVVDPKAMVKKYSRSSADQKEPLPHDLRPVPVLEMTMNYLLCNVIDCTDFPAGEWFDFVWDRTRAIRKDITIQHPCDLVSVGLIEKCARFHIYCGFALCTEELAVFDPKINDDNIAECLQTLRQLYHDLAVKGIACPNENEFRCYDVLFNLTEGGVLRKIQQFPALVQNSAEVKFSIQLLQCLMSNNYVKFFRLVRGTTYLNTCLLHRYFSQIRFKALRTMIKAYSHSNNPEQIPLAQLVSVLAFEDVQHARNFCSFLHLPTDETFVTLAKVSVNSKEPLPTELLGKSLVECKKRALLGEIINGGPLPLDPYPLYQPHSSFDNNGRLKPEALDASDQQSMPYIAGSTFQPLASAAPSLFSPMETAPSFSQQEFSLPSSSFHSAATAFTFSSTPALEGAPSFSLSSSTQKGPKAFSFSSNISINAQSSTLSPITSSSTGDTSTVSFTKPSSSKSSSFSFGHNNFSFMPSTSRLVTTNTFTLQVSSSSFNAPSSHQESTATGHTVSPIFQSTSSQAISSSSNDAGNFFKKRPQTVVPFTFKTPSMDKGSVPGSTSSFTPPSASFSFVPNKPSSLRTSSPFFAFQPERPTNENTDKLASTFCDELLGEVMQEQIMDFSVEVLQQILAQEIYESLLKCVLRKTCSDFMLDEQRNALILQNQVTIDVSEQITNAVISEMIPVLVRDIWAEEKASSLLEGLIDQACGDIISEVVTSAQSDQERRRTAKHLRHLRHINFISRKYFERWQQKVKRKKKLELLLRTFPPGPGLGPTVLNSSDFVTGSSLPVESLFNIQKRRETSDLLLDAGLQVQICRERYAASPIPLDKMVPENALFKILVLVPHSLSDSPAKAWICSKFSGRRDHTFESAFPHVEQLSLFKSSKKAYISTSCISGQPEKEHMVGASAIISLCGQEPHHLWQVKSLASHLNPAPAICAMTIGEENIDVPSEIRRFSLINHQYEDSLELIKAFKWLLSAMPPSPSLKSVPLKDYVLDGLCCHVFTRMAQCYDAAPSLEVDVLLSLYAAGLNHLLSVLTSSRLQSLTWPPPEFRSLFSEEEASFIYPKEEWNSYKSFYSLQSAFEKLRLPLSWEGKEDVTGFLDLLQFDLGWFHDLEPSALSERINFILENSKEYWSGNVVPWPEILSECVYELINSLDWKNECGEPLVAYYFEDDYKNFNIPPEWNKSILSASKSSVSQIQPSLTSPSRKKPHSEDGASFKEPSLLIPPVKVRRMTSIDLRPSSISRESQLCLQQEEEIARERKASRDFLAVLERLRDEGASFPIFPTKSTSLLLSPHSTVQI